MHRTLYTCTFCSIRTGLALSGLMGYFCFWFLICYIVQPSLSTIFIFPSSIDIANMHTNFRHPSSTPSKKSTLRNPNVLFFWRSCARMLIFGSHVHKAKLTLHAKILLFGAEHVLNKLQAPTPPPPSQLKPNLLWTKSMSTTLSIQPSVLFFFFFFFFFCSFVGYFFFSFF